MTKSLPYLEVSGNYEEIGIFIGKSLKNKIQKAARIHQEQIPNYNSYLQKTKPYFEITKKYFPHLIVEIEAIAKGANVAVDEYFFINNREVYDLSKTFEHCTVAVSFGPDEAIVGHNEDWDISNIDDLYVLKATTPRCTFLGLQYSAALAVSATMNSFGLVQCINDLSAKAQMGVPKNFIARAILECSDLDEAENLIRNTPCASGFNHVLVQGNEVRNFEISGDKIGIEKIVGQPYVHTNHFLTKEMADEKELSSPSSVPRYKRAKEIVRNNMAIEDMKRLLSDIKDSKFPICRESDTIGSAIFQPKLGKAYFCYGPPCSGEFVPYPI